VSQKLPKNIILSEKQPGEIFRVENFLMDFRTVKAKLRFGECYTCFGCETKTEVVLSRTDKSTTPCNHLNTRVEVVAGGGGFICP